MTVPATPAGDTSRSDAAGVEAPALSTEERLLTVAERLFAEHGIDAVSVRAITIEAEANIAAVHYHFGTKLDLVRALVERRVGEVNAHRLELLRALDAAPTIGPRDIATVWVQPLARLALDTDRRSYLGFLVALTNSGPELRAMAGNVFRPHFTRIDAALERALPDVDPATRRFRFAMLTDTATRSLADLHAAAAPWRHARAPVSDIAVIEALLDALTGLLAGPPPPPRPTRAAR